MFNRTVVQEALKHSLALENNPGRTPDNTPVGQDSEISLLIYNIFGGEILKTHKKNGWHFYNRIDGKRIDFTRSETGKSSEDNRLEDIPSTPDEINNYFEQEDYSTFLTKFIRAFEEVVGLDKYRPGLTA